MVNVSVMYACASSFASNFSGASFFTLSAVSASNFIPVANFNTSGTWVKRQVQMSKLRPGYQDLHSSLALPHFPRSAIQLIRTKRVQKSIEGYLILQVFDLSEFYLLGKESSRFELGNGFRIGGILIGIDHMRSRLQGVGISPSRRKSRLLLERRLLRS